MRLDHHKTQIDVVLVQDKVVTYGIHDNIDHGVTSPAGCITKGLQGHDPAKGRIKEIYEGDDAFFE